MFFGRLKKDGGFTLVELMVVVAIIGLLSAVAIPNFKKYQAKAKTSEAKLQLASIYSAETSWFSDYDAYGSCLNLMGYDPGLEATQRYYTTGFGADANNANKQATNNGANTNCAATGSLGTAGAAAAGTTSTYSYPGSKKVGNVAAVSTWITAATYIVNSTTYDTFLANAIGVISPAATTVGAADSWSINENKKIGSVIIGY